MKWESDKLEGKPENVFIGKWLPQDDILAHKNVKLFISHCGMGSTVESKYHGVPIVGIPIFADQDFNIDTIVDEGWAIRADLTTLTEQSLSQAINEILENPKGVKVNSFIKDTTPKVFLDTLQLSNGLLNFTRIDL